MPYNHRQGEITHILELFDLTSSIHDLIAPIRLDLFDLLLMFMKPGVHLLVELLNLSVTIIDVDLGRSEFITKDVDVLSLLIERSQLNLY